MFRKKDLGKIKKLINNSKVEYGGFLEEDSDGFLKIVKLIKGHKNGVNLSLGGYIAFHIHPKKQSVSTNSAPSGSAPSGCLYDFPSTGDMFQIVYDSIYNDIKTHFVFTQNSYFEITPKRKTMMEFNKKFITLEENICKGKCSIQKFLNFYSKINVNINEFSYE